VAAMRHEADPLDTPEEIARLLRGKKSGSGWSARCPAHEDGTASLSISRGTKQPSLLTCHAGCTFEEIIAAIRRLRGSPPQVGRSGPTPRKLTRVAEYLYRNADGTPFSTKTRCVDEQGEKTFFWKPTLNGARAPLYRLDEIQGKEEVLVPEGEKDVDRLWSLGLPATCNAHGASKDTQRSKWTDEDTKDLVSAGVKHVAILRDEDETGLAHAHAVAQSCQRAGIITKPVELPDLPDKKGADVSDWLDAGHTRDELLAVIEKTNPYLDVAPLDQPPARTHRLVTQDGTDIVRQRISWLWSGRVARGVPTLLIGDPDLGKGLTLADFAARITTGRPWPDEPADTPLRPPGHVIILSAEDPAEIVLEPRLCAAGADPRYYTIVNGVLGADDEERGLSLEQDVAELDALAEEKGSVAMLLDPVNAYLATTETNTDNKVRVSLKPLIRMIAQRNMAVIALMHLGKDSDRAAMYRSLGSIGFTAAARASFCVARDPADPESLRRLFLRVKFNIGPKPAGLIFEVTPTSVPAPDGGEAITTAKVVWLSEATYVSADEALGRSKGGADKEAAAEQFLEQMLGSGPVMAEVLKEAARGRKISRRVLEQAKKTVGVKYRKVGLGGAWECYLGSEEIDEDDPNIDVPTVVDHPTLRVVENGPVRNESNARPFSTTPHPQPPSMVENENINDLHHEGGRDHSTPPHRVAENGGVSVTPPLTNAERQARWRKQNPTQYADQQRAARARRNAVEASTAALSVELPALDPDDPRNDLPNSENF